MTDINFEQLAKSVGKAIARQRQQAGLTQERVAELLGIGMEAVSRMERGIVVPTVVRLAELAQLFGCELADFLRETSNRPTEQSIVMSQQLAKLDDADRTLLLDMLDRLVERLAR
ncbi:MULTISPECIES: helix-turn-helix domain-containing protein [Aeromonas]|jgi:transcriptional regulator with XRE-family HTH domain|uniref:helix-turn-helix domain-containing protein n=1 Tax=Aeromonas TaxID=642 RepID=UPI000C75B630|nr:MULTISPECIES: helix-turn-helix domain-containing protein [Aeromonas]UUM72066.1 helix-turn-helix domain-containing protein [Aeromonas hydrophila]AWA07949.1 helix-turn-helix domain-containing protein [Aeromonas hydrophila subsp. hydrophila]MBS4698121.1 helix-turn-helix domain-containing protein [Aeromonas allosaccharophila]MBS4706222.1 helix-turn-helix domain-containing protein [Aeromonas veronii]MDX7677100.1 helix-turn-helix domain-containing protein [Aeromonas caviae]